MNNYKVCFRLYDDPVWPEQRAESDGYAVVNVQAETSLRAIIAGRNKVVEGTDLDPGAVIFDGFNKVGG